MASIPSSGTIWVDPADRDDRPDDGSQVETIDGHGQRAQRGQGYVDVVYRHVDELDMWLPASMDERFEVSTGRIFDRVTGHAEYSNYRRFTTSVRIK